MSSIWTVTVASIARLGGFWWPQKHAILRHLRRAPAGSQQVCSRSTSLSNAFNSMHQNYIALYQDK